MKLISCILFLSAFGLALSPMLTAEADTARTEAALVEAVRQCDFFEQYKDHHMIIARSGQRYAELRFPESATFPEDGQSVIFKASAFLISSCEPFNTWYWYKTDYKGNISIERDTSSIELREETSDVFSSGDRLYRAYDSKEDDSVFFLLLELE